MAGEYTPVSNIEQQAQLSLDLRDISAVTGKSPIDWAKVKVIYEKGANSKKGDGSARTFMGVATKKEVLAQFPHGAQILGSADFLNANVQAAIAVTGRAKGLGDAARRQLVDKGILAILYGEFLEEMEAAQNKVKQGMTDNAKGAPHNVDEAWAYYAGAKDGDGKYGYALASTAGKRERNFKIEGKVDGPLQRALAATLRGAQQGDLKALDAGIAEARGYLNAIFYLASLRYVSNLAADATAADRESHAAEGWGFFQAIRPAVASASVDAAKTVESVYACPASQPVTAKDVTAVYQALNSPGVLQVLGIPRALVFTAPTG
ncbi:MAG: hypothetical protein HY261_10665 [Chloroflexi bacterium]|nr:hypothetical protein [Chloroflexota bacterium]